MEEKLDRTMAFRQKTCGPHASRDEDGLTRVGDGKIKVQRQEFEILSHEVNSLAQYAENLWLEADEMYAREMETEGHLR